MPDTGSRAIELRPATEGGQRSDDLGIGQLIDTFRRRIWVFALTAATIFMLVAFATITATRLYTATARVQLDMREKRVLADMEAVFQGLPMDTSVVETETEILMSRSLAGQVVDRLDLVEDAPPPPGPPSLLDQLRGVKPEPGPRTAAELAAWRASAREEAISGLLGSLRVERLGATYLIDISITGPDPKQTARVANAYADQYLAQQLETKYDAIARANEWLSNRLDTLRLEVLSKERVVEDYKAQTGLLTAEGSTLTEQSLAQVNAELVTSRANLAEREARLRAVESAVSSGGNPETAAEALNSPVIAQLRAQQGELSRQRAELSTRLGPRHPDMMRITRENADVEAKIQEEIQRIVASLRNDVVAARNRVASVEGSLGATRSSMAQNNVGAVKLRELEREAEASRTLYQAFLNRFKQIAEQSSIEQADARVQSQASVPLHPSSPNTRINLALGLILGIAAGAAAVFLLELLERSLRTPEDVQNRLGLPCLGAVPFLDRRTRMVDGELVSAENFVMKRPVSAFGEALRSLRASIFFANPDRRVKVLAVTSALPNEGKTTTAIGLARISALAGSKTVLVDCDLRRRSATHVLGIEAEKGLTEILFNSASLQDVIKKDPGSGVDVVPLAQAEFTPRDLFGSEAMHQLIETLRGRYDVIVIDTAPVLPLADTRVLAGLADSVLLVVRWGRTPATLVQDAIGHLKNHGARLAGVALDGVETSLIARLLYDRSDYYSELYQTYYIR